MQFSDRETLSLVLRTLSDRGRLDYAETPEPAYTRALGDLLQLLQLAHPVEGGIELEDDPARLFVRSLAAHIADNVPLALPLYGNQLLVAAEAARREQVVHPTPVREIFAVNAIIKARCDGQDCLLMQYDPQASQFQLIGGKREPDDPDAEFTVLRELREELELPNLRIPDDLRFVPIAERFERITLSPTY